MFIIIIISQNIFIISEINKCIIIIIIFILKHDIDKKR